MILLYQNLKMKVTTMNYSGAHTKVIKNSIIIETNQSIIEDIECATKAECAPHRESNNIINTFPSVEREAPTAAPATAATLGGLIVKKYPWN